MKIKFNYQFIALFLLAGVIIFSLGKCKNVGPSEWPEPIPDVSNQLKFSVFNSEDGTSLQGYDIKIIQPDGTSKEFSAETGTLTVNAISEGSYTVTASKDGFLAESIGIEVDLSEDEDVSTVTQQKFFLSKKGDATLVTPQGTTISADNNLPENTTIEFPYGALNNEENVTVTFLQPPYKNGGLKILGERLLVKGYNFSPDMTFTENKPTVHIPINIQSVKDGAPLFFGSFDNETQTWEMIEGELNEERTVASFEMPHFSSWYAFTGYRLVKTGYTWAPWEFVAESDTCGAGVCGTYIFAVTPSALISQLISFGYNINLKVKDTKCVGPHYKYAQQLFARCRLVTYNVYDYTGTLIGSIQIPMNKFQWMVDEYYCHDQGGG